jgi:transposase
MARFDLTDAEWSIIFPLLPGAGGKNGRPRPGRSQSAQRHLLCIAHRHTVARPAGALRPPT